MKHTPTGTKRMALALTMATILAAATGCTNSESRETPDEKAEWSVLQAVEFKNRDKPLAEPTVQTIGGHEVLGLRSTSGRNVWILLKPTAPPYYKQLPSENYILPAELAQRLIREHRVSYTVESVLESRVDKP